MQNSCGQFFGFLFRNLHPPIMMESFDEQASHFTHLRKHCEQHLKALGSQLKVQITPSLVHECSLTILWSLSLISCYHSCAESMLLTVKIIMDKISKRSKGYAFIEYTTEEAAGAALKEMNGKVPKKHSLCSFVFNFSLW